MDVFKSTMSRKGKMPRSRLATKPIYRRMRELAFKLITAQEDFKMYYECPICELYLVDNDTRYTLVEVNQHMFNYHDVDDIFSSDNIRELKEKANEIKHLKASALKAKYLTCPLCILDNRYNVYISNPNALKNHLRHYH